MNIEVVIFVVSLIVLAVSSFAVGLVIYWHAPWLVIGTESLLCLVSFGISYSLFKEFGK